MLRNRIALLSQIGDGFGRSGVLGKWVDAFGSVTVTLADGGAYRVVVATNSVYRPDEEHHWVLQGERDIEAGWTGLACGHRAGRAGRRRIAARTSLAWLVFSVMTI